MSGTTGGTTGGTSINDIEDLNDDNVCPPQEQRCAARHICVPCPTSMTLDANCQCTCLKTGDIQNPGSTRCDATCDCPKVATCTCTCPGPSCIPPKVRNEQSCFCECPDACPSPQAQNPDTCACTCLPGQHLCLPTGQCLTCPTGKTFDPGTCTCVCPFAPCAGECCPEGQVCDFSKTPPACCAPDAACPPNFCGTVSNMCGGQQACVCEPRRACCGTACADLQSDPMNCGSCSAVCRTGTTCEGGVCTCEGGIYCDGICLKGAECCENGDCADRGPCESAICGSPFPANTCGYATAADGLGCPDGVCCGAVCLTGKNCCDDAACSAPETCQDNLCICIPTLTCPSGRCGLFPDSCDGQRLCTCPAGQTCCDETCVDTLTSTEDCGACGVACPEDADCINGECVEPTGCPLGLQPCQDECISCPPEGTLNPDTCDCVCETITLPTDGATVTSQMTLVAGRVYTIRVSGTFNIGGGTLADASYLMNQNGSFGVCGDGSDIGVAINDPRLSTPTLTPASWGPFNPANVYTTQFTGLSAPIGLNYHECIGSHANNRGTLTVEILCDCPAQPCEEPRYWNATSCSCVCPGTPANSTFVDESTSCDWVCTWESCGDRCCNSDQVCDANGDLAQCCTPQDVCPDTSCGAVPNGCGGAIDRGPCPEVACRVGVCQPGATCATLCTSGSGGQCTTICQPGDVCSQCVYGKSPDNGPGPLCDTAGAFCCGGDCCQAGQVCNNGTCCTPSGFCPANYCGTVTNGCGGQLLCQCGPGQSCCGGACVDSCSDDQTLNPETCECECPNRCPQPQVQNPNTCGCACPDPCPEPFTQNDACECVCPDSCPPGATRGPDCECICETITLPTDGTTVMSQMSLIAGRAYTIRVRGTFDIGGGTRADASYLFRTNPERSFDRCSDGSDIAVVINDPRLSSPPSTPASWGAYNADHVYTTIFTGLGAPIGLNFHECVGSHANNRGTLTVEILCDCPAVQCNAPKVQSPETCTCVCPDHAPCTGAKSFFDDTACTCVCPPQAPCTGGMKVNRNTCKCECPNSCPAGATRSAGTCDCVCETLTLPTDGTTVMSKLSLGKGQVYTIRVRGTFDIGNGTEADASYLINQNGNFDVCGDGSDIAVAINDPRLSSPPSTPASWGPFNPDHVYSTQFTGLGAPIGLNFHECVGSHGNNRGTLTVEILCPTVGSVIEQGTQVAIEIGEEDLSTPVGPGVTGATGSTGSTTGATGGTTGGVGPPPTPVTVTPGPTGPTGPSGLTPTPPTPTPTPTPTPAPDCSDDELECGGRCIPAAQCPPESCCLDAATCECTCPVCTEFEVFDPRACACDCAIVDCPPNYQYDETACTCTCIRQDCPLNHVFSDAECACICQPVDCAPNFQFDAASCSCVCIPFACPANFQFDPASCSCVCLPPACPANYQFDPASCTCFCAELGCAEGELFDPESCVCLPAAVEEVAEESA